MKGSIETFLASVLFVVSERREPETYTIAKSFRNTTMEMGTYFIDFVVGFLKTNNVNNAIWVIIERLNKIAHFLLIIMTFNLHQLAQHCIKKIVKLHGFWYLFF